METHLGLFCLIDLSFLLTLSISSFISFKDYTVLLILIAGAFFTYYPLWIYAKEFSDRSLSKDRYWYFRYKYFGALYVLSRFFLLFIYVIVAIDDTANLDIPFILKHFPLHVKIISIVLLSLLIIMSIVLLFKTRVIFNQRAKEALATMTIHVDKYIGTETRFPNQQLQLTKADDLKANVATRVLLTPGTTTLGSDSRIPRVITNMASQR
jgi:hypothetical protein